MLNNYMLCKNRFFVKTKKAILLSSLSTAWLILDSHDDKMCHLTEVKAVLPAPYRINLSQHPVGTF
jgi:hypothetical protein